MPPISLAEPTGRYLSFEEREEIALLRAKQLGVREIARRIDRDPERSLESCAATRYPKRETVIPGTGGAVETSAGGETPEVGEARDQ